MSQTDIEILNQLKAYGSDLQSNMILDFHFVSSTESEANACYDALVAAGEVARLYEPGSHQRYQAEGLATASEWLIECSVNMRPRLRAIDRKRKHLEKRLLPLGAAPDGWASYGNRFSTRP